MAKRQQSVKSIVEPLLDQGLSEGAIRAQHPELNPESIHGAVQRYRRERGITARKIAQKSWYYLSPTAAEALQQEADRRGVLSRDLASRILTAAIERGAIEDLLADTDKGRR